MKRLLDLILSTAAFLVFSPLFLLIIILVKLDSQGPAFYIQVRIGRGMRPFRLIKFRSMAVSPSCTERQFEPGDSGRITRIGSLLRKTKLDELPELINIIRGDMSIVGPRPEVPKFVEAYPQQYDQITRIRPGLSDFASIKYRHEEEILAGHADPESFYRNVILPDKLALAEEYCRNITLSTDLKIVLETIKSILSTDYADYHRLVLSKPKFTSVKSV